MCQTARHRCCGSAVWLGVTDMQPLTQPMPFGTEHRLVRRQNVAQSARKAWPRNHALGFTLVEVLVALASMALLSVLSWQGIDTLLRTREITQSQVNDTALVQASLRQWHMDWDAIQPLPDQLPHLSSHCCQRPARSISTPPALKCCPLLYPRWPCPAHASGSRSGNANLGAAWKRPSNAWGRPLWCCNRIATACSLRISKSTAVCGSTISV